MADIRYVITAGERVVEVHESGSGLQRRFAAMQQDAFMETEADDRQTQPAPLRLTRGGNSEAFTDV
jgi:hypothetical protein